MAKLNKLSAAKVAKTKKPGRYGDGGGLWLHVSQGKGHVNRSWVFRYTIQDAEYLRSHPNKKGRAREMGLGAYPDFTLEEARERARKQRKLLADDIDPLEARNTERHTHRLQEARVVTFKTCAEEYIQNNKAGWKNAKHASQWENTLATYAYPHIGDLPVAEIDTNLVLKALRPIWETKAETARRVRGRIEAVLNYATVCEYRDGDNPARWRGHLNNVLPNLRKGVHFAAMPYADLPAFMKRLRENENMSARALEFTILSGVRTSQTIGATWDEIDFDNKMWIVPAERMKAEREHRVPLSDRMVEILTNLPREGDGAGFVFPGARNGRGLTNMAMLEALKHMDSNGYTVHGFRSTFRDWCAEQTAYANEVAEMALAHVVGDKTEAAYRRGDLLEKRIRLMQDWARYCEAPAVEASVVPMRAGA